MPPFSLTESQKTANAILASRASHIMLYGGSRSGKTFLYVRAITIRAIKAPSSRHAMLRFRLNSIITSVALDTLPKVMNLCHPGMKWELCKQPAWYVQLWNDSQIWLGGLDDKERTEKILGNEYATIFLNECSQIPFSSRELALTRLAQSVSMDVEGQDAKQLPLKMYYDENPPDRAHWTYRLFEQKLQPETREPLANPQDYVSFQMNPKDNAENLPAEYLLTLQNMSSRMRRRFWDGQFRDSNPTALFRESDLDKWRVMDGVLPDMQRIIVAVDPSGAGDIENQDNDAIGIVVVGLAVDGNGYLLEDLTVKAGPGTWGKIVVRAFIRWEADCIVAETNFGGAMVGMVIRTAVKELKDEIKQKQLPFQEVHASRGKVVRAEPLSPLVEDGRIRFAGVFADLEDELAGFNTNGYTGEGSPNRADAMVWGFTALFPGIVTPRKEKPKAKEFAGAFVQAGEGSWMV